MTINDIRRENARLLAKEIGGDKQFADRMEMDASQVSQIIGKSPVKNIGHIIARRIEAKFQKPEGWLDMAHQESTDVTSLGSSSGIHYREENPDVVDVNELLLLIELYRQSTKQGRGFIINSARAAKKISASDDITLTDD
jgi:hypothetical protein